MSAGEGTQISDRVGDESPRTAPVYTDRQTDAAMQEAMYCHAVAGKTAEARTLLKDLLTRAAERAAWQQAVRLFDLLEEAQESSGNPTVEAGQGKRERGTAATRNSYMVGGWVRSDTHYGRDRFIQELLGADNPATLVIGPRRAGKTSLLRHIEWLVQQKEEMAARFVPLYWNLEGCERAEDLQYELAIAIEDSAIEDGKDPSSGLEQKDTLELLAFLEQTASETGKQILLLVDETEALITVAAEEAVHVEALLGKLQTSPHLRTILVATRRLLTLFDRDQFDFARITAEIRLSNLWRLERDAGRDLIRQKKSVTGQVRAGAALIDRILDVTNQQPYLIQYLCHRLFQHDDDGEAMLRPLTENDFEPDLLLSEILRTEYEQLSATERRILLAVSDHAPICIVDLAGHIGEPRDRVVLFVQGLCRLGYLRRAGDGTVPGTIVPGTIVPGTIVPGTEFLKRWLAQNREEFGADLDSLGAAVPADAKVEAFLKRWLDSEAVYLAHESTALQHRVKRVLDTIDPGQETMLISPELADLRERLKQLSERQKTCP